MDLGAIWHILVPLDFWIEARKQCDAIKPLFWLAECDEPIYHQAFDLSYAWNWMHVTEKHSKGEASLNHIHNSLHSYSQYPFDATKLYFTSNHDENSWNGTEHEKYGPIAKAWWVFSATWQGLPLIYSGQEIPNHRRLRFFDKDALDWNQPCLMESFFQSLLALRKSNKALSQGETFILPSNHSEELMGYIRKYGQQVVLVLLNLSTKNALKISVDHPWLNGSFESLFTTMKYDFLPGESFELMAGDYLVYHLGSQ